MELGGAGRPLKWLGVRLVLTDDESSPEARHAFAERMDPRGDPTRQFPIETFAEGEPVESDGLLSGAERLPFGVVDQIHTPAPGSFVGGDLFPSDRPVAEIAAIEDACARALAAGSAKRATRRWSRSRRRGVRAKQSALAALSACFRTSCVI